MSFVDEVNKSFYDDLWRQEGLMHRYPNVNTVRCEGMYFRKNGVPGKLLDFGFGSGQESVYFAEKGYDVYALEVSQVAVDYFNAQLKKEYKHLCNQIKTLFLCPEEKHLPYEDGFFDWIHSNQVIYHLSDEKAIRNLMQEWYRILKPGGRIMYSTVGKKNSTIVKGKVVEETPLLRVHEAVYDAPNMSEPLRMRVCALRSEDSIREISKPFIIEEIGWFTNHYCGVDGFHWQVLAKK